MDEGLLKGREMSMKNIIVFFFICISAMTSDVKGQDMQMDIPENYTHSVDSLAFYIDTHCTNDEGKLQALYGWITTHMKYNVFPTFVSVNEKRDEEKEIVQSLLSRQGVCREFAKIFEAVATRMDIPAFFVEGYTKSNGVVMTSPHAWCVALVNGRWYNYDPTFGMGYLQNQRFVPKPNMDYCKVEPKTFLQTHMPFDPIWQLVPYPYTYQAFDKGDTISISTGNGANAFNFADSIRLSLKQTPVMRLKAVNNRMMRNGEPNPLVTYYLQLNASNINVFRQREVYDSYKRAVKFFNQGVDHFNEIIRFQRAHRKIKKDEKLLMLGWIDEASKAVAEADKILKAVQEIPEPYMAAVTNLKSAVSEFSEKVRLKQAALAEL